MSVAKWMTRLYLDGNSSGPGEALSPAVNSCVQTSDELRDLGAGATTKLLCI
jgi:hypothetical protein